MKSTRYLAVAIALHTFLSSIAYANARRVFAAFNLESACSPGLDKDLQLESSALYFAYRNSAVDQSRSVKKSNDINYDFLDNAPSGISVVTRNEHNEKYKSDNGHLVHSIEGWCYILSLTLVYPRVLEAYPHDATTLSHAFFYRCLELNKQTTPELSTDYRKLLKEGFHTIPLEDVYLFEKWSLMCPRPSLFDDESLARHVNICKTVAVSKEGKLRDYFYNHRQCFLNDFTDFESHQYGGVYRSFFSSFANFWKSKTELHKAFLEKWSLVHMPKLAEIELNLDDLLRQFVLASVKHSKCPNSDDIYKLVSNELVVHFVTGHLGGELPGKVTVGLSFDLGNHLTKRLDVFDYHSEDFPAVNLALSNPFSKFNPPLVNAFSFDNIYGTGQHRSVDLVVELDTRVFKQCRPLHGRFYVRVTQLLDTSVYLDREELNDTFTLIEKENLGALPTAVVEGSDKARVRLQTLKLSFTSVEDPQVTSAPVTYSGYVALGKEVLDYPSVVIRYKLPFHTRYVHMNKTLSKELSSLNVQNLVTKQSVKYTAALVAEPNVQVYVPPGTSLHGSAPNDYLDVLRNVAFGTFAASFYETKEYVAKGFWQRCYTHKRGVNSKVVDPCYVQRTGVASIGINFTNAKCATPRKGHRQDSRCYLTFSIPVSSQRYKLGVVLVTAVVILASSVGSLFCVDSALKLFQEKKRV